MMTELFLVLLNIMFPVFILLAFGVLLQRKFRLDLNTLSKVNIYYLVPALIFVKLYKSSINLSTFFLVAGFYLMLSLTLWLIAYLIGSVLKYDRSTKRAFENSIIFCNSGNYAIPLNDLVFRHDPFALSIQVLAMAMSNITTFTYGILAVGSARFSWKQTLSGYARMPVLYAIGAAVLLSFLSVPIPEFVMLPLDYVANALIAIALLTLGAQIAKVSWRGWNAALIWSASVRLLGAPCIAIAFIVMLGLEGITAQALLLASAVPTSVNSALIAQEFGNKPEFAAQTVVVSTLASSLTMSGLIYWLIPLVG